MPASKATSSEKITVTREDVLTALGTSNATDLNTAGDVARLVVTKVYDIEEPVYDNNSALYHLRQADFKRLLADMVADGTLVLRKGEEWYDHGAPTWLGRPNGHYYALPEKAREWEEQEARRRDAALQEAAEEHARRVLAERYPEDFGSLVHAYRVEHGAAVAEEASK